MYVHLPRLYFVYKKVQFYLYKRVTDFTPLHGAQFLQQCVELRRVVDQHVEIAAEQSVVTVDVYRLHYNLLLLRDDACDVVHDAEVVVSYNAQRYVILRCSLAAPSCFHYSIAEALAQFGAFGQSWQCILMPPFTVTKPNIWSP